MQGESRGFSSGGSSNASILPTGPTQVRRGLKASHLDIQLVKVGGKKHKQHFYLSSCTHILLKFTQINISLAHPTHSLIVRSEPLHQQPFAACIDSAL